MRHLENLSRKAVLSFHGLSFEDFGDPKERETIEKAVACADQMISYQRDLCPDITVKHPDIKMPMAEADLFWYVMCKGTLAQ